MKIEKKIKHIENCVLLNQNAYQAVKDKFQLGMNELDILGIIRESYYKDIQKEIEIVYDVFGGQRTSKVSDPSSEYILAKKDTLILDLLPKYNGVFSDTTRTFFVGDATERQREIYQILLEAMQAGQEQLRPGAIAKEIYNTMYQVFEKYHLGTCFPHHAGHGLGYTYYEEPIFLKDNTTILQEDMVVALEPGLYLKDQFGIRIENNFRITNDGCEELGNIPLNIEHYILEVS